MSKKEKAVSKEQQEKVQEEVKSAILDEIDLESVSGGGGLDGPLNPSQPYLKMSE